MLIDLAQHTTVLSGQEGNISSYDSEESLWLAQRNACECYNWNLLYN